MEEKLQALFQDEDAVKEVFVEDVDQTLANLAARGIEMNEQELGELTSGILSGMGIAESDELSEEELENVAGGGLGKTIIKKCLSDVAKAVSGGFSKGRADKKSNSISGFGYVESANTAVGKGYRAIGYALGRLL